MSTLAPAADAAADYRARSLWLDGLPGALAPRPSLAGEVQADVAVVGAGFTGLWTAYSLARLERGLRVVVVEREIAGFGPAGRNGGFVSPGMAGEARVYAREQGREAVRAAEREVVAAVAEIGRVVANEGIDCAYRPGGSLRVATSRPQLARAAAAVEARRAYGFDEHDVRLLGPDEVRGHVRMSGALGAVYTPHCAIVDPARLARGLADACERRGVAIYERTPALAIEPRRVSCAGGVVHARTVVQATESYSTTLQGQHRRYLPIYSHMIATEPLPAEVWDELGWSGGEAVADLANLFFYAQRTADDRIAVGGRGASYHLRSAIRPGNEQQPRIRARLEQVLRDHFPAAAGARVTHHWGGPFAAPRDWSMSIELDRESGLARAGGYSGHGVTASNIAGRTLADLILDRDAPLVRLPWVGHRSRRWEPEPVRLLGTRGILAVLGSADRHERRTGRPARRTALVARWVPGR